MQVVYALARYIAPTKGNGFAYFCQNKIRSNLNMWQALLCRNVQDELVIPPIKPFIEKTPLCKLTTMNNHMEQAINPHSPDFFDPVFLIAPAMPKTHRHF